MGARSRARQRIVLSGGDCKRELASRNAREHLRLVVLTGVVSVIGCTSTQKAELDLPRAPMGQGPPTSPIVCDGVFFWADQELEALTEKHGAVYTRYMDDLCFSGPSPLLAATAPRGGYCQEARVRHQRAQDGVVRP